MSKYDIIIIGAGISGLSMAHYCSMQGLKTLVIEKSDRIGGTIHSHKFQDINFWVELGAHTCYNSYVNLIKIMEETNSIKSIINREKVPFRMLVNGQIKSIPSQLNFLELLFSFPSIFTTKKSGMDVKSYYSRIIGKKNFARVLSPALNAVISQIADEFPADMLFKKRSRKKDIIKKFTLINGLQTITDTIEADENIEIVKGSEVLGLDYSNGLFNIKTKDAIYASQMLAIATTPNVSSKLLQRSFPEIAKLIGGIEVKKINTVAVAIKAERTSIPPSAGIIPINDDFFSIVTRDTVKDPNYRGFVFHFKPDSLGKSERINRIVNVLSITASDIIQVAEKENFVPSLRLGHESLVRSIDNFISGKPLFLTGNYFDGLAIEDCVSRSYKEFLRLKKFLK